MKRVIRDFRSLDADLRDRLAAAFPQGIQKADLLAFPVGGGRRIYGVELVVGDTLYIIKGDFREKKRGFTLLWEGEEGGEGDFSDEEERY
ncbi:MAG: hypothetical protein AAGN35_00795 [Bacteroidota bacterium]